MKLLFCKKCGDIFSLNKNSKTCTCQLVGGKYLDNSNIEIFGDDHVIVLGFNNQSFVKAIKKIPEYYYGNNFVAFVINKTIDIIHETKK